MKIIDINNWKRKVPYTNFITYADPIFSLTTRLDVTELCARCKRLGTSFFTDFLYIVTVCLNQTEALRLRIKGDNVVLYDTVHPNYIVLSDDGVIVTCQTYADSSYEVFYKNARAHIAVAKRSGNKEVFNQEGENDRFYVSCLPWVDLAAVRNPYDLKDAESSSIPRLTWGKYTDDCGRMKMMFDVAAHHALLDGEPVCRFFLRVQNALENADTFFD